MRLLTAMGKDPRGLTLIELVITMAILAVLASVALPVAEVTVKRSKELELRRALRTIRTAIDDYKADFERSTGKTGEDKTYIPSVDETGYPETLEVLVEGKDWGDASGIERKYLRRIPEDPFDQYDQGWGLRSYRDDPDSTVWSGEDVYDVYSQSDGIALDGTPYSTW